MSANLVSLYCLDCGTDLPPLNGVALECPRCGRRLIGSSIWAVPGLFNRTWGTLVNNYEPIVYSSGGPARRAADQRLSAGYGGGRQAA